MAKKDKKSEEVETEVTEVMVPEQTEPLRVEKPVEEEKEEEKPSVLTI